VNDVRGSTWVELQERLFGETWHEELGELPLFVERDGLSRRFMRDYQPRDG
jgi:hypothetical protein